MLSMFFSQDVRCLPLGLSLSLLDLVLSLLWFPHLVSSHDRTIWIYLSVSSQWLAWSYIRHICQHCVVCLFWLHIMVSMILQSQAHLHYSNNPLLHVELSRVDSSKCHNGLRILHNNIRPCTSLFLCFRTGCFMFRGRSQLSTFTY